MRISHWISWHSHIPLCDITSPWLFINHKPKIQKDQTNWQKPNVNYASLHKICNSISRPSRPPLSAWPVNHENWQHLEFGRISTTSLATLLLLVRSNRKITMQNIFKRDAKIWQKQTKSWKYLKVRMTRLLWWMKTKILLMMILIMLVPMTMMETDWDWLDPWGMKPPPVASWHLLTPRAWPGKRSFLFSMIRMRMMITWPSSSSFSKWSRWYAQMHVWPYLAYLGAPKMVKWDVPEQILQNAVQTRWS